MAGVKLFASNLKVKASSILEVLISMIIILVVFTLAMMITTNVIRSSLSVKKIRAEALLNQQLTKIIQHQDTETQPFSDDDIRIERHIVDDTDNPALQDVRLTAYDVNQEKIAELKRIIFK